MFFCKVILLLCLTFHVTLSMLNFRFSPEMLALAKNATEEYAILHPSGVFFETFPNALTNVGVASDYHFGTLTDTLCNPPTLTRLFAPYGTCFKNYIGNQPNCSIVQHCLTRHGSTFQSYTACLTPTVFLYTSISAFNTSSYLVRLFIDDACTVPFVFFESLAIPFGCQAAQIYDENNVFCGNSQNIYPSDGITVPTDNTPFVIAGIGGLFILMFAMWVLIKSVGFHRQ